MLLEAGSTARRHILDMQELLLKSSKRLALDVLKQISIYSTAACKIGFRFCIQFSLTKVE